MTANLAVAFERMGLNTLVLDLDPQEGNLTSLFDVGESRSDPEADKPRETHFEHAGRGLRRPHRNDV